MQVIEANWDHTGTGERPLLEHPGWAVVDRIDIAHLASERAHGWHGAIGVRKFGDPTARWSLVTRETGPHGLVIDGGRTIRGKREEFTAAIDPAKPVRLILRTGGPPAFPHHETINKPTKLEILDGDRVVATTILPVPAGSFVDVALELPAGSSRTLRTRSDGPYRAYHWFVLQPE
jgi:hypothetical protein